MNITFNSAAERELYAKLAEDPALRLSTLYKIVIKGDDEDDDGLVMTFTPNRAQRRLIARMWHRNIILKARQLGFTTLVCILWLDAALWAKEPIRCGIVAQDREAAEAIFRGKVRFAYERLPEFMRNWFPLSKSSASELEFAHNGSSVRVATSMRSGTIHRLHISEFGKICAKYPEKAREVVTGSIPAVPKSGILIIESTAEGRDGDFYKMTQRSKAMHDRSAPLSEKDYRFHFYPWWDAPEYSLDEHDLVPLSEVDHRYFNELESRINRKITHGQRAWYVATRETDFSGDDTKMWQEYPSTAEEAFQVSTDGCYYADQMAKVRTGGRIVRSMPVLPIQINTFWDVGRGDMTTIWFHQFHQLQHRFVRYYESSGEDLIHYAQYLQRMAIEHGYTYGIHFLPHDADYKRMGETPDTNRTIKEMLESLLPGQRFEIVPRVTILMNGIQATRASFPGVWFDEEGCAEGIKRLDNYRKKWNKATGAWADEPLHDDNSHGADAFRQWGQVVEAGHSFAVKAAGQKAFRRSGSPLAT